MADLPNVGDIVEAEYVSEHPGPSGIVGIDVTLPGFGGRAGFVLLSDAHGRFRPGRIVKAKVLRVDKERGFIDLSPRAVLK